MKLNRVENSTRNIFWGIINRIVGLVIPFFMRTLLIYIVGIKYLGLSTLFASILQVLSLAEMGFSTAIVYSLYKPISDRDTAKICALMNVYKRIYRIIGSFVLVIGVFFAPFIPKLIKGTWPQDVNIYILYFIYLTNTVLSYMMLAYKRVLFLVHQRNDIDDKITSIINISCYVLQAALLLMFKNYYLYVVITPIQTVITNIVTGYISTKKYPDYSPKGGLNQEDMHEIYVKVKSLCLHKFGNTISNSFDSIIISAFLGLSLVAKYGNYNYIVSFVISFLTIVYGSFTAGLGNSIAIETTEKNYEIFNKLCFLNFWIRILGTTCLLCLYQPFMVLWVGAENALAFSSVIFFCLYFYVFTGRKIVLTFKDAAGMWEADKWKPIIGGLFNLVVNIILVKTIGINGVVVSTILSHLLIEQPWETKVLFERYFKKDVGLYYTQWGKQFLLTCMICSITFFACNLISKTTIATFIVKVIICFTMPNIILIGLYRKDAKFSYMISIIKRTIISIGGPLSRLNTN